MDSNIDNDFLTLRDLWEMLIANIWLFVISVVLSVSVALAYIIVTPPMYERSASVLIKNDDKGGGASSSLGVQGFEDLGIFKSNTNINNEINILLTPDFMVEVVKRLGLEYNYKSRVKGVRWVDVYLNTPFVVIADSMLVGQRFSFDVTFTSDNEFEITSLNIGNEEIKEESISATFSEPIETAFGSFELLENPYYTNKTPLEGGVYRFSKAAPKSIAKKILNRLNVTLRHKDASIVDIALMDENSHRAENIINALISVYNENWIKDRNEIAFNTSAFIDERLQVIEQELESVDGSIAKFKSEQLIPDMGAVAGIQLQQTSQNRNEQLIIRNQLSMARYIQSYLNNNQGIEHILPANTGINNAAIEKQIVEYNELLLQKNILLANSSENNPLVADMMMQLRAVRNIINISINDQISTLSIQLNNLENTESENKENLSSTPRQAKELLGVERQQMIKEQLFLYLLQKREENELSQAFSAYNTKTISSPDGLPTPKEPKKMIIILFALVVGGVIPVIYLITKESLDTVVKTKADLEGLNIPFLGTLPQTKILKLGENFETMALHSDDRGAGNESFRVLRSNIDFMIDGSKQGAHIIQFVSLLPNSGKTFISSNISISMACKESKVLLIDCDIRKSTLSQFVGTSTHGMSEYLNGKSTIKDIDDIIIKGIINENLDFIPVGQTPPNPSELLLKPKFGELLEILKSKYDYIFIDCPPVEIVPDSAIIAKFCDTTIFVVRANVLDKRLLPEIDNIYKSGRYNNMCLLLNGVHHGGRGYYGYRKYGYYGYGEYINGYK